MARVLVVDDEPDVIRRLRTSLEQHGHVVSAVGSGAAALAAVRKRPPDVLVLGVRLPKLDGWGVLERLKADEDAAVSTVPVVLLMALDAEQEQLRGGIEGALRCVAKPVAPEALVAAVEGVLQGGPEPAQRKAVQQRSLARLAQLERGADRDPSPSPVRLSHLERERRRQTVDRTVAITASARGALTERQRELLRAVRAAPTVSAAAADLGMSRSNLYASLRRIGRTLDVPDVSTVVRLARAGELTGVR